MAPKTLRAEGRGWLADSDRALGLQQRAYVIQRPVADDINKGQPAEVQHKPPRMPGDRQEAPGQCGGRGDAQFAVAATVATTPSELTI